MRIFVTVGTQKYQFKRLIMQCDKIAKNSGHEFRIQQGNTRYKIKFSMSWDYLDNLMFLEELKMADIVICHCGTGTLFEALELGKKVIAIPRLKKYKEHKNDHQLEMFEYINKRNYCLCLLDVNDLEEAISNIHALSFEKYSSYNRKMFCENLKELLDL